MSFKINDKLVLHNLNDIAINFLKYNDEFYKVYRTNSFINFIESQDESLSRFYILELNKQDHDYLKFIVTISLKINSNIPLYIKNHQVRSLNDILDNNFIILPSIEKTIVMLLQRKLLSYFFEQNTNYKISYEDLEIIKKAENISLLGKVEEAFYYLILSKSEKEVFYFESKKYDNLKSFLIEKMNIVRDTKALDAFLDVNYSYFKSYLKANNKDDIIASFELLSNKKN